MNAWPFFRLLRTAGVALIAVAPLWCVAQVYKCTEDGKAVYQSQPCRGDGKVVHYDPGPNEQAVREARARAAKDVAAAAELDALKKRKIANAQMPLPGNLLGGPPKDCTQLMKDVENAFGQRNGLNHATRDMGPVSGALRDNLDQSANDINRRLASAQAAANQAGCM